MTKLPEKLSDCIELALRDLRKVEDDPRYRINMYTWHEPMYLYPRMCNVCFAGAVMANTLETPIEEEVTPTSFDKHTEDRLNALNKVRCGNVRGALQYIGIIIDNEFEDFFTLGYRYDPEDFHAELGSMALRLREAGY